MEIIHFPDQRHWKYILKRPVQSFDVIKASVKPILEAVSRKGDAAVKYYSLLLDKVDLDTFQVGDADIRQSTQLIESSLKAAIETARKNIYTFHTAQSEQIKIIETSRGVRCWRRSIPIEKVGLYIPGGTSPLFSTVLMLGIPAKIAGCPEIILCTPPNKEGQIDPTILYTANLIGINKIFKIGGAQAIATMAYGTETVPAVNKIFGPGNQYVTAAKQLVSQEGVAIDLPAGPSEVAIIADESADPDFIAADLLSQAEHGIDSQVLLVTDNEALIDKVKISVSRQLKRLPRRTIAESALENCKLILLKNMEEALALVNTYAPEHLILMVRDPERMSENIINAGSVFLGAYTPEAAGDYASGTNHTLPTSGFAAAYSGVSVDSFVRKITFQKITESGLQEIGPVVERMAEAEGLEAHRQAVRIRLNKIEKMKND